MSRNDTHATTPRAGLFTRRGCIVFLGAFAALYLAAGAGVDYAKAYVVESELQAATMETAAIFARKLPGASPLSLQLEAERRFAGKLAFIGGPAASIAVTVIGRSVRVSAEGGYSTIFLRLLRQPRLPIDATATVNPPQHSQQLA